MEYLIIGMAVYLIAANILITRYVWRDCRRTTSEKLAESGLVWFVPFFGHLVALAISLGGPETVRETDPAITAGGVIGAISVTT